MAVDGHNEQVDKLDEEIAQLEGTIKGENKAKSPVQNQAPAPPNAGDNQPPPQEAVGVGTPQAEVVPQAPAPQEPKTGRRSWKNEFLQLENRYNGLRQSSDQFKFETRQQLAGLQDENVSLRDENEQLKVKITEVAASAPAPVNSAFSEEDVNILGEGTINSLNTAVNTAVSNAVDPLQAELLAIKKAERDRIKAAAAANRGTATSIFRQRLGQLVPDYADINRNPAFVNWLNQQDPYGGAPRMSFFKNAERSGDVGRAAQYFVEFKQLTAAPVNLLSENASPVGGGGGSQPVAPTNQVPEDQIIYPYGVVDKFYDDDINGLYRGREALRDELDKKYDLAMRQGRVR